MTKFLTPGFVRGHFVGVFNRDSAAADSALPSLQLQMFRLEDSLNMTAGLPGRALKNLPFSTDWTRTFEDFDGGGLL